MTLQVSLIICFYYLLGFMYLRRALRDILKEYASTHATSTLFFAVAFTLTAWPYIFVDAEWSFWTSFFRRPYIAEIWFNTDSDGRWVEEDEEHPVAYYGPFKTPAEANEWIEQFFGEDEDVYDDRVVRCSRRHRRGYVNDKTLIEG